MIPRAGKTLGPLLSTVTIEVKNMETTNVHKLHEIKPADLTMGTVVGMRRIPGDAMHEDKIGHVVGFELTYHGVVIPTIQWSDGHTRGCHPGNLILNPSWPPAWSEERTHREARLRDAEKERERAEAAKKHGRALSRLLAKWGL